MAPSASADRERAVFLNIPFDDRYERLYIALIAGLVGLGLLPRTVLQVPPNVNRLERLFGLLQECGSSIHDLSRVQLETRKPRVPRFNMPFEAGLAYALMLLGQSHRRGVRHAPFVFEATQYRLQKSCSDLNGADPCIHGNTVEGMLRAVTKAFQRRGSRRTLEELLHLYRALAKIARELKRTEHVPNLYDGTLFSKLAYAAQLIARRQHLVR